MNITKLIEQNRVPNDVNGIGLFKGNQLVARCDVPQEFRFGNLGTKLYTFGSLSDVHLQHSTGQADFIAGLTYLDGKVDFITICGDLTTNGTAANLTEYKTCVETYAGDTPIYAIAGNHENYGSVSVPDVIEDYTGHPMYYSFTQGNDVFVMLGIKANSAASSTNLSLFTLDELQWLYETLEANRDRRCFVFEHVRPDDVCGNAYGIYTYDIWGGLDKTLFESIISHYPNVILWHGHSHLTYKLQEQGNLANLDRVFGCWSIHVPSLAVPRTGDASGGSSRTELYAESEGYIVDVYPTGLALNGFDFVEQHRIPQAQYWIDTSFTPVAAGTYTDPTGHIVTDRPASGKVVIYTLTGNFTFTAKGNVQSGVPSSAQYPVGAKLYAHWDNLSYSGADATTEGIGFMIQAEASVSRAENYQDYSTETELIDHYNPGHNIGEHSSGTLNIELKASSSSTSTFPATYNVSNFEIYYYNEVN